MAITRSTIRRIEHSDPCVGAAERGGDQSALAFDELGGRELARRRGQNLGALHEPTGARAHLVDGRALVGCSCERLQDGALVEGVRAVGETRRPRELVAERALIAAGLTRAARPAFLTALEQLGHFAAPEAELPRAGSDLFAPGVGVDPVLLSLPGHERRRLRRRLRVHADAAVLGRAEHFVAAL